MRKSFLSAALMCSLLLSVSVNNSYAGYVVKAQTEQVGNSTDVATSVSTNTETAKETSERDRNYDGNKRTRDKSGDGWQGILAFVFGILGPTGIMAVIFGAIGMQKGKKHRELAMAGFILGLLRILVFCALLVAIAMAAI